jgi:glycosyltransferase involved in cell wall biosynthesis
MARTDARLLAIAEGNLIFGKEKTGMITVAISTLDRPDKLARCLDSLLAGDVLPSEIIVVDQGQERTARGVVEQRQKPSAPPLRHLPQNRRGLSASRNAAIAHASAPVIAFTDDDCVPDPGWVAAIDQTFASQSCPDAVAGSVLALPSDCAEGFAVSLRESKQARDFTGKSIPWNLGTGGNFALKKEWFDKIGVFDERLGAGTVGRAAEDSDVIYRLLCAGALIRYEPTAIVFHELQSREKRLSSRWNYGYGIGAFCAIWLRRKDPFSVYMFSNWVYQLSRELAIVMIKRQGLFRLQQVGANILGALQGLIYGFRIGGQ